MNQEAYEIMVNLKNMFQVQARNERFVATKALSSCRMTPGTSASAHVLKMKGYLDTLERLEVQVPKELAIDLILASLSDAFDEFVKNYKLQEMTESVMELYGMLRTAEKSIQKSNPLLKVKRGKIEKKGNWNDKAKPMGPKPSGRYPKFPNTPKANQPKLKESESTCFHCNQVGHWKKNCKLLKEEKKRTKASNYGIMLLNNMSFLPL